MNIKSGPLQKGAIVGERVLNAYIDNELEPEKVAGVKAYLAEHPEAKKRVQYYTDCVAWLAQVCGAMLREPLPERLESVIETWVQETVGEKSDGDPLDDPGEESLAPAR